jgi:hypothetical protein
MSLDISLEIETLVAEAREQGISIDVFLEQILNDDDHPATAKSNGITTVQISRERDRGLLKTRIVSRLDGHLARAGYRVAEPTVLSKLDGRA